MKILRNIILTLIVFYVLSPPVFGQNATKALEYWTDGNSENRTQQILSASPIYNWEELINCSTLQDGVHTFHARFCDNEGIWTPVESFFFLKQTNAAGQTTARKINALEYYIDNNLANLIQRQLTASQTYDWEELINCNKLQDGVHTFNVRFRDDGGIWTTVESFFFLKQTNGATQAVLRKINALEYCVDNNISDLIHRELTATETYNWDELIDCNNLQDGVHTFNVRFRNDGGVWTNVQSQFFLKKTNTAGEGEVKKITALEYWMDGNSAERIHRDLTAQNIYNWEELLDFSSASDGVHTFNVRFKDDFGVWTNVQSQFFLKHSNSSGNGIKKIDELEYWIDENSSSRTNKQLTESNPYIWEELVDVNSITQGLHTFNARFKDSFGVWTNVQSYFFFKDKEEIIPAGENKITGYRIWYSKEPNYIESHSVTSPQTSVGTDDLVPATYLPKGKFEISYQIKDSRGVWSTAITDSISKTDDAMFSFWADKQEILQSDIVKFTPSTVLFIDSIVWNFGDGMTEVSYEPEHQYNDVGQFDVTATVWHRGSSEGMTYVEIKYITVSPTGVFAPKVYTLKMYPIPATDEITIESPSAQMKSVRIISLNGTVLKDVKADSPEKTKLSIGNFSPGTYIIVVKTNEGFMSNKILKK